MDPDGPGSRILAELIAWQALSKAFLETPDGVAAIDTIQQILRDSNRIEVFTAACQAMCDMDLREWLPRITSPALVLGGDEDLMTPWDQGPGGAGQQAIADGIPGAEKHVIRGSNHSTIFDNTAEHNRVVIDFFTPARPRRAAAAAVGEGAAAESLVPAVEEYGVEPIPRGAPHGRLARPLRDQLHLLPQPGHVPARRARRRAGGLPLWWAVAAMVLGQALAFALLLPIAEVGVDHGLPGQVALRATLGFWGARLLSSPYRVVAATYWFAAQALTSAYGFQAIVQAMTGHRLPLVPVAIGLAFVHAALALLGFDVMRYVLRVVLPLSLALTGVLLALYLASDDPRFAAHRVFRSPDQHFTWVGFATYVTVMCGASLTLVTNVADVCRYTRSGRDMRIALLRLGGDERGRHHVRRRLRGGGHRREQSLRRGRRPDERRRGARRRPRRDRRPVPGRERDERLHGRALARELGAEPGPAPRQRPRRRRRDRPLRLPGLRRPRAEVDRASRQRGGAADRRHPRGLPASSGGRQVDVAALYEPHGRYRYLRGVNVAAVAATAAAVGVYYACRTPGSRSPGASASARSRTSCSRRCREPSSPASGPRPETSVRWAE